MTALAPRPRLTVAGPDDVPTLPIRKVHPLRGGGGRHRAPIGTPPTVATWSGGRHYKPETTR